MGWQVDRAHTQVSFAIKHLGVSLIRGNMELADAELVLDEANPERSRLTARLDAASIDTRDATRDGHVKSPDFLEVEKYPFIEFTSKRLNLGPDRRFQVTGDLSVHGVTREVSLDGEYAGPVLDPISGKRKVGFLLTTVVSHQDYGLTWNVPMAAGGFMLDEKITLTIDAQAIEDA
jgi:polyisoprenoid-binding protein YceI